MVTVPACAIIIVYACTKIIVHACTMVIVYACMIIVHACTMIVAYVSCPTRRMFGAIEVGGPGGAKPPGKAGRFGGPPGPPIDRVRQQQIILLQNQK